MYEVDMPTLNLCSKVGRVVRIANDIKYQKYKQYTWRKHMKKVHDQSTEKNSTISWFLPPKALTNKIGKLQDTKKTSHYQACSFYCKPWIKNSVFIGREKAGRR